MTLLIARCGYRGSWLVLLGTVWVLFGIGAMLSPLPARPWALVEYLPPLAQSFGWWATGAVAVGVGLRRQCDDSPGHVALYVMPTLKVASYVVSFVVWAGTSAAHECYPSVPVQGWGAAWYAALIWALVSVMLLHAAAWPDPKPVLPEPPSGDERSAA